MRFLLLVGLFALAFGSQTVTIDLTKAVKSVFNGTAQQATVIVTNTTVTIQKPALAIKKNNTKLVQKIFTKVNQTVTNSTGQRQFIVWKKCAGRIATEQNLKVVARVQRAKTRRIQRILRQLTSELAATRAKAKFHNRVAGRLSRAATKCQSMILSRLQALYGKCSRHSQKVKKYQKYLCTSNDEIETLWKSYKNHWAVKAHKNLTVAVKQPIPSNFTKVNQVACYAKCYNIGAKSSTQAVSQMKCFGDCVEGATTKKLGKSAYSTMLAWVNKIRLCEKNHYALLRKVVKCIPFALNNKPDCPKVRSAISTVRKWSQVTVWPF